MIRLLPLLLILFPIAASAGGFKLSGAALRDATAGGAASCATAGPCVIASSASECSSDVADCEHIFDFGAETAGSGDLVVMFCASMDNADVHTFSITGETPLVAESRDCVDTAAISVGYDVLSGTRTSFTCGNSGAGDTKWLVGAALVRNQGGSPLNLDSDSVPRAAAVQHQCDTITMDQDDMLGICMGLGATTYSSIDGDNPSNDSPTEWVDEATGDGWTDGALSLTGGSLWMGFVYTEDFQTAGNPLGCTGLNNCGDWFQATSGRMCTATVGFK